MKHITISILLMVFTCVSSGRNHLYDKYKSEKAVTISHRPFVGSSYRDWEISAQEAFNVLYKIYGRKKTSRSISYKVTDWQNDVTKFLRVDYDNIPILSQPDLNADNLKVLGFSKSGEFFQFVDYKQVGVEITSPGDWGPQSFGDWYEIKTIDGHDGWIFSKPYGLINPYASIIEKETPNPTVINNTSDSTFPYGTIIIIAIVVIGFIAVVSSHSPSSSNSSSGTYSSTSSSYYDSTGSSYGGYESSANSDVSDIQEESNGNNGGYEHGKCPDCDGLDLGSWGFSEKGNGVCNNCHGTGLASSDWLVKFATFGTEDDIPCEVCSGTKQCQTCGGKGVI
jgi:hypothetical protein